MIRVANELKIQASTLELFFLDFGWNEGEFLVNLELHVNQFLPFSFNVLNQNSWGWFLVQFDTNFEIFYPIQRFVVDYALMVHVVKNASLKNACKIKFHETNASNKSWDIAAQPRSILYTR